MDKRTAIIFSAIDVFQEQGIEKTKIADIVKRAGIAQGTFYLYFPSKLALMPAIAEVMVERTLHAVGEKVDETAGFFEQMDQLTEAIFMINKEYSELLAIIYSGLSATEHLNEWETVYAPVYRYISDKLQAAKEAGIIRSSVDADRTAKMIIGLVESAAEQIYLYDADKEDEAKAQRMAVNDFLQHALKPAT